MSRGLLDDQTLADIQAQVPEWDDVRSTALSLAPDYLGANFSPDDYTPVAAVCFHDCTNTIAEIRYAIVEHFAHGIYYREYCDPPNPLTAAFFERYYLDDAALRLYAAGEHLANAVLFMLNVDDTRLERHRKTGRVSQQSVTAAYLRADRPAWTLTDVLLALGRSDSWKFAVTYRNRWVHEQPPTVAGAGIAYRRRLPWRVSADGTKKYLAFGSGDEPEFDTSHIRERIIAAYTLLVETTRHALESYFGNNILDAH